jgi:hypothetical protein
MGREAEHHVELTTPSGTANKYQRVTSPVDCFTCTLANSSSPRGPIILSLTRSRDLALLVMAKCRKDTSRFVPPLEGNLDTVVAFSTCYA